jgi:hypothetical protein
MSNAHSRPRWSRPAALLAPLVTGAALIAGAPAARAATAPDVRGTYSGTIALAGSNQPFVLDIASEDVVTGTFGGTQLLGPSEIDEVTGTIDGTAVSFSTVALPVPFTATGTLTASGGLSGDENVGSGTAAAFVASRLTGGQAAAAAASVDGVWQLRVVAGAYTPNGKNAPDPVAPVGQTATQTIRLASDCNARHVCTETLTDAAGATTFVGASGFTGLGNEVLARAGATLRFAVGGYGNGPCTTAPPPFGYNLTLTVTGATPSGTGWVASGLTGTETVVMPGCQGASASEKLTIESGVLTAPAATASAPASAAPSAAPSTPATTTTSVVHHASFAHVTTGPAPIARALPTPAQAFTPLSVIVGAAVALGFLLFITFPAALFNKTFEENYATIREWWARPLRRIPALAGLAIPADERAPSPVRGRVVFAFVLLVGAVFGGLLNPSFGANAASGEALVATLLAQLFGAALGAFVGGGYRRLRGRPVSWHVRALPAGLAVAAVCLLVSRLSDFQPGYLYGIVAGVVFAGSLADDESGHVVALSHLATLAVAVGAWFAWVPVNHAATQPGAGAGIAVLDDVLGSIFAGGLVGTVISLIPLRFMPGHTLARWHRGAWAAVFGIATFGLVDILVRPTAHNHAGHAPIVTVVVLFVFFGGGSLAFRWYFERRAEAEPAPEAQPTGEAEPAHDAEPASAVAKSTAPEAALPQDEPRPAVLPSAQRLPPSNEEPVAPSTGS